MYSNTLKCTSHIKRNIDVWLCVQQYKKKSKQNNNKHLIFFKG